MIDNIKNRATLRLKRAKTYLLSHDLALAAVIASAFIILAIFLGWSNNNVVPLFSNARFHYVQEPQHRLSFLSNWDGPDYLNIVQHGYHNIKMANFFPVYPMAVKAVNFIVPSLLFSALIVAWASLVVALFFYIKIIKFLFKASSLESIKAVLFFLLFPTGIFLIATYSESLFAALSLGALYAALRKKYLVAALLLMFSTATHITGVFIVFLIALVLYEQKVRLRNILLTVIIGLLGIGSYMFFNWKRFHNPVIFIKSQEEIHGWVHHSYSNLITSADVLNVILMILLIVTAAYWWNRRRSFSLYSLSFFAIPIVGRQYGGFNRYLLMAFPLQFMLYDYFKKKVDARTYMYILMATGWTYFVLEYAGGYVGS